MDGSCCCTFIVLNTLAERYSDLAIPHFVVQVDCTSRKTSFLKLRRKTEDEEKTPSEDFVMEPVKRVPVDKVSTFVFEQLSPLLSTVRDAGKQQLQLDEECLSENHSVLMMALMLEIRRIYRVSQADTKIADTVARLAVERRNELLPPARDPEKRRRLERLRNALNAEYIGDTHTKLYKYIARCWERYSNTQDVYLSPMRVLYTCVRSNPRSTGFPVATDQLKRFFFRGPTTQEYLTGQLLKTFKYAQENWDTVGDEWFPLFTKSEVGASICEAVTQHESTITHNATGKKETKRLVVLVVDEARTLLVNDYRVKWLPILHRSLRETNLILQEYGYGGGIFFAVLIDTNSKVHDFTPPTDNGDDLSSRSVVNRWVMFPPFVLTHTMDVFRPKPVGDTSGLKIPTGGQPTTAPFDYKTIVSQGDSVA
ncbi:unnamed protein product [Phytophthora lilii]|uniref:Unnamed protein product n=1 Tax=Phytophthora lilii TaxID=2077276 RepID=A0A9W6TU68_9STRA|nr:unnamed protein product [Phytophthora lilii]